MPEEEHANTIRKTILIRWQEHEKYRNSQQTHGWLDFLTTIDISNTAPWHQRHRYESTATLVRNDDDRQAGPMGAGKDFNTMTKIVTSRRQEQGRQNSCIPGMAQPKLEEKLLASFFFIIFTTVVATRTPRHSMARSKMVERVMAADPFKAT